MCSEQVVGMMPIVDGWQAISARRYLVIITLLRHRHSPGKATVPQVLFLIFFYVVNVCYAHLMTGLIEMYGILFRLAALQQQMLHV